MADIFDLADAFLLREAMSNKRLQKLCYYAQAWHLALTGDPLVPNRFEAWVHGPVCPELYSKYKDNGSDDIPQISREIQAPEEYSDYVEEVLEAYGHLTTHQLELLTHEEDPWRLARKGLKPWESCNNVIAVDSMRDFYRSQLLQSQS